MADWMLCLDSPPGQEVLSKKCPGGLGGGGRGRALEMMSSRLRNMPSLAQSLGKRETSPRDQEGSWLNVLREA